MQSFLCSEKVVINAWPIMLLFTVEEMG